MNLLNILLMAPQQTGAETGASKYSSLIMIALIIVVFYFFMIRPQMRKAKEERKFRESLQRGAHVVTTGGIHGVITQVNETSFQLEIATGVFVTIEKASVMADLNATKDNYKK